MRGTVLGLLVLLTILAAGPARAACAYNGAPCDAARSAQYAQKQAEKAQALFDRRHGCRFSGRKCSREEMAESREYFSRMAAKICIQQKENASCRSLLAKIAGENGIDPDNQAALTRYATFLPNGRPVPDPNHRRGKPKT